MTEFIEVGGRVMVKMAAGGHGGGTTSYATVEATQDQTAAYWAHMAAMTEPEPTTEPEPEPSATEE